MTSYILRTFLGKTAGMVGALTVFGLTGWLLFSAPKAEAQTAPQFVCDGTIYIAHGATDTQLTKLNAQDTPVTLSSIGAPYPDGYNAMGFNYSDGYLYGYDTTNEVYVRIAADGTTTSLGNPSGMPTGSPNYLAGDFDGDGYHNMLAATGSGSNEWVVTDVSTPTPTLIGSFTIAPIPSAPLSVGDIAYNPKDGKFYGMDTQTHKIVMFTIDASYTSGTVTYLPTDNSAGMATGVDGLHGAAAIDAKGNLLTTQLKPGKLYSSEIGMNGSGSGKSTFIYDIPSVERYDGAACPYAPLMEKEASPRTVKAGEQLTYTYTVYNALVSQTMTYNFSDTLSDGRTFIGASLDNSYGGTANAYAGQANLSITGMSVPASSSIKFSVKVQIPSTASAKVMTNQAVASGFNIASFPAELKSDDPITVIFGDPTAVTVTALTAPGTPDTGIDFGSANTWVVVTILSALSAGLIWLGRKTTKLHTEH